MGKEDARVRDQLGNDPDTFPVLNLAFDEIIGIEEGSMKIERKTLGHAWIVGSPTNGIVGVNVGTEDGQQQVVGGAGRVTKLQGVINPAKIFNEHFRDTDFKDAGNTTGDWNTTDFDAKLDNGEQVQSNAVAQDDSGGISGNRNISAAKLGFTSGTAASLTLYLSNDNGSSFEEVTKDVEHTFADSSGTAMVLKIVSAADGVTVEDIRIEYR